MNQFKLWQSHWNRRWSIAGLVLAVLLALPLLVFADNLVNTVTSGGNEAIPFGGSTTIQYKINATGVGSDGQQGCNAADDGSPATVTIQVPAGVTASKSTLVFTQCNVFQSVTFSSSAAGSHSITHSVSDSGVGTYNNQANFTLHVGAPPDSTPPVINSNISGLEGDNGWYTSDVIVSWSVSDLESSITSSNGCGPVTINQDTAGLTLTCSATSAGGTRSESVTIKRDATPPTIAGNASPGPNGNGWNNTNVAVAFNCGDSGSGIASCGPTQTLSGEGANQSAEGTAVDMAGNQASTVVAGINIDKSAPTNIQVAGFSNGSSFFFGYVPAAPTGCTADGALSGLVSCTVSGYAAVVGNHVLAATATDAAGNVGEQTISYQVASWTPVGFYSPVDMAGANTSAIVWNTVKAGSTVPLKFELFMGQTELTDISLVTFTTKLVNCTSGIQDAIDATVLTTEGTSLRYDAADGQFIQNWKTPKQAGKCYQVTVEAKDGSRIVANFWLK